MRTGNPTLSDKAFMPATAGEKMTIEGAVNKTLLFLLILFIPAVYVWQNIDTILNSGIFYPLLIGSVVLGLILAIVTVFVQRIAFITGPAYAFVEGVALGLISVLAEKAYPGIVIQAVGLTFGTLFTLLIAYKARLFKVTQNFRLGVFAATGSIMLIYLVSFIGSFFGFSVPVIHGNGLFGIGFSVIVIVIAALNLVLDFDFIENASGRSPKYMEWYAAFGLMVTLVWLYIEILRLLIKLRSR